MFFARTAWISCSLSWKPMDRKGKNQSPGISAWWIFRRWSCIHCRSSMPATTSGIIMCGWIRRMTGWRWKRSMHRKESSGNLQIHFENSMSLWLRIFFSDIFWSEAKKWKCGYDDSETICLCKTSKGRRGICCIRTVKEMFQSQSRKAISFWLIMRGGGTLCCPPVLAYL